LAADVYAYTLDQLGNSSNLVEGNPTGYLNQNRDHNVANEIDLDTVHGDADDRITASAGTN
jgi:hypothetical protein